jgi:SAM-dependent methyltransferase
VTSTMATGRADALQRGQAYACPRCHAPLDRIDQGYSCGPCGVSYPVRDEVPDFAPESELYWGELSPSQMSEAIRLAREQGYQAAAHYAASCVPSLEFYMLSEKRIDWLFHALPLAQGARSLDIGSGWGTLSRALTPYFQDVFSLEIVRERVAFQRAFREKEGLLNLHVVRGSATRLPFPDQFFDLVLANGIIQWVGLDDHTRPVPALQADFLREAWRTLRPGGTLVMGCENRYALSRFLGGKDHTGLPYTSLLPRRLAGWVVRRYRHTGGSFVSAFRGHEEWRDYRTWTHSTWGYERLLRAAGFNRVDSYWVYPSDNLPGLMGRLDDGNSVRELLDFAVRNIDFRVGGTNFARFFLRLRWAARLRPLMRLVQRLLTPDMFFVARRDGDAVGGAGLDAAVGPYSFRWSGSNKVIWFGQKGKSRSVVKAPRFPRDAAQVATEERVLGEQNGFTVEVDRRGERVLYREPFLEGRPIDCLSSAHNLSALEWLVRFQRRTKAGGLDPSAREREVTLWLDRFDREVGDDEPRAQARAAARRLLEFAGSSPWPQVAEHGDFWWRNLLRRANGELVVIDWQHHREKGDPLFDFALLVQTHWETARAVPGSRGSDTPKLIAHFAAATGLSPDTIYAYFPYALVRRAVRSSAMPRAQLLRALRDGMYPQEPAVPSGTARGFR